MRQILVLIAALAIGCGTLMREPTASTGSSSSEELVYLSPSYRSWKWDEPAQCPDRSRLALHGECWRNVDVDVEPCRREAAEGNDDTARQESCRRKFDRASRES